MAVWVQVRVRGRGLTLRHIVCTLASYVTQQRRCSCSMPMPIVACVGVDSGLAVPARSLHIIGVQRNGRNLRRPAHSAVHR